MQGAESKGEWVKQRESSEVLHFFTSEAFEKLFKPADSLELTSVQAADWLLKPVTFSTFKTNHWHHDKLSHSDTIGLLEFKSLQLFPATFWVWFLFVADLCSELGRGWFIFLLVPNDFLRTLVCPRFKVMFTKNNNKLGNDLAIAQFSRHWSCLLTRVQLLLHKALKK